MLLAQFLGQILEKSDIFSVYIFHQIRKSFKQVKRKYNLLPPQATYNDLIVIHGPISVLYALPLTAWHFAMTFRKPIFVVEKKTRG